MAMPLRIGPPRICQSSPEAAANQPRRSVGPDLGEVPQSDPGREASQGYDFPFLQWN